MLTLWYYIDASLDTLVSEAFSLVDSSGRVHENSWEYEFITHETWVYTQVNFSGCKIFGSLFLSLSILNIIPVSLKYDCLKV